jgi:hypothetical protein
VLVRQVIPTILGRRYLVRWLQVAANQAGAMYFSAGPTANATPFVGGAGVSREHVLLADSDNEDMNLVGGGGGATATLDNISVQELDTSVPSLQAFTLFITLADRPRSFDGTTGFAFFALNNASTAFSSGFGLLVRVNGTATAIDAGGNSSACAPVGGLVSGKNVIAVVVDVANKRLALFVNGSAASVLTTLDYTGIGSVAARLRGLDGFGTQSGGVAMHESLEVLPLMSDAAAQAECARRFALP